MYYNLFTQSAHLNSSEDNQFLFFFFFPLVPVHLLEEIKQIKCLLAYFIFMNKKKGSPCALLFSTLFSCLVAKSCPTL